MLGFVGKDDSQERREKKEQYRSYLQLQIEQKENRVKEEKRKTDHHPLGPNYESPFLPYQQNARIRKLVQLCFLGYNSLLAVVLNISW
jgi:hypothetical protein